MATEPTSYPANGSPAIDAPELPSDTLAPISSPSNDTPASTTDHSELTPSTLQTAGPILKDQDSAPVGSDNPSLSATENATAKLLPVPSTSIHHGKPSQASFVVPDGGDTLCSAESEGLSPEIAKADVSIAADGSFVQTTSALAARELKKCYDRILGVGQGVQGVVRSPYAITAVRDEQGTSVFRISHRIAQGAAPDDTSPPEASTSHTPGHAIGSRRKARLSVHDFLPSSMFKSAGDGGNLPRNSTNANVISGSTPPVHTSGITSTSHIRRKLRKTRSNSDLHLRGVSSLPAAGTSDSSGHMSPPPRSESFSIEIRDELTAGSDPFGQVLGWTSEIATDSVPSSRKAAKTSTVPVSEDEQRPDNLTPTAATGGARLSRRPSVSTSAALSGTTWKSSSSPFGDNISYAAPIQRSSTLLPSRSFQVREMQSFESGLTAKAGDTGEGLSGTPKSKSNLSGNEENESFPAVKSQTRFSTSVFDVLQNYSGLPLPSSLLAAPPTGATIKFSSTDSPNPKDDPRFVIWGEIQPDRTSIDDASVSQSGHTDLSGSAPALGSSTSSRKRSNARSSLAPTDSSGLAVNTEAGVQTVLIAATVERWIAQLTSELNYDELLNFLLTYRTYISPVDLCHLLICRFCWALQKPSSMHDDMVRRIVRARTFIAIRYWLLTFFHEDFLPNAELCHLFTTWLNDLFKDSALKNHPDSLSIVRKLKNVVRECKAAHIRRGLGGAVGRHQMDPNLSSTSSVNGAMESQDQGTKTNKNSSEGKLVMEIDDSDVDLDFSTSSKSRFIDPSNGDGTMNSHPPLVFHSLPQATVPLTPSQGNSAATPSANAILLSQPLSMAILGHVKSTKPGTDAPITQGSTSLPGQHGGISRAIVNTIGKLGRWKRVLNARSSVSAAPCGDMSAFDLEPNATGDLLAVRGGVEEYLKMLNLNPPVVPPAEASTNIIESESDSQQPSRPPGLGSSSSEESTIPEEVKTSPSKPSSALPEGAEGAVHDAETGSASLRGIRESHDSFFASSEAAEEPGQSELEYTPPHWAPEVVSLDDYDLSDSDSSSQAAAKVRRLPRRLPLRRDFQFVRRSVESVSSMGICSQSSLASSFKTGSRSGSLLSRRSTRSDGRPLVTGGVQQWQIELISDDEDEAGDVEAALRRLEGQIDLDRQREKDLKVGRWLKTASKGRHRDSVSSIHSGSQLSDLEDEEDRVDTAAPNNEDVTVSVNSVLSTPLESTGTSPAKDSGKPLGTLPLESSIASVGLNPAAVATTSGIVSERDRSGSVSSAQLSPQSHPASRPSSSAGVRRPSLLNRTSRNPQPSKFGSNLSSIYRSFILMHRSETLAQQFAIIESELFVKIKFEELISHQWGQSLDDVDVRDWVQFVKERAKLKHTGKKDLTSTAKLSSILALRARFDLFVNFTSSEILLTHPSERVMIVEKFIRIAWKAYLHNNFSTLVALMAGLQTRWVNQVMSRHWHRVGMWEQRVFEDLKKFTSRPGQFKYLRNATAVLIDARPLHVGVQGGASTSETTSGASSMSKSRSSETHDGPTACVPFLGVYLAQLYEYERLPDYVDPTAPAEPVLIDSDTGTLSPPSHPEVFYNLQTLPLDLTLEPLINVHKQRVIAGVVKSFVGGQHLSTKISFEVDQKCYQKCFRLRSLDSESLHSLAKAVGDQ